jgi:hypothetical protein
VYNEMGMMWKERVVAFYGSICLGQLKKKHEKPQTGLQAENGHHEYDAGKPGTKS